MAIRVPSRTRLEKYGYVGERVLGCPTLIQPDNGESIITPTTASLAWSSIEGAKTYRVFIWPSSQDEPEDFTAETTATGYLATGLSPSTSYTWKIIAFSVFGTSVGCGTSTFTTTGTPSCPNLIFPNDSAVTNGATSVTLQWGSVSNATSYYVYVWLSSDSEPASPTYTTTSTSQEATGLTANSVYTWKVVGVNDAGYSSGCGSRTFTTASSSVQFTASNYPASSQSTTVTVYVSRTGNLSGAASVQYATSDNTAVAGVNYTSASGTLNWADGDGASKTFDVVILSGEDYSSLLINLTLSSPINTQLGEQNTATITIPSLYSFVSTTYVNIAATSFGSNTTVVSGTVVTVSALSTDRIIVTKPSIDEDSGLTWDAWRNSYSIVLPLRGWLNNFRISNQANTLLQIFGINATATEAEAFANIQASFPIVYSGHTQYKFWAYDSPISDNFNGLSLRVDLWRLT